MKEKLALLLGMVLCTTMTFSAGGLAWAQPPNQPEPPKTHRKVCLQWTKIVKWSDEKFQKENKHYWVKAEKAYAYQAVKKEDLATIIEEDYGLDPDKFFWKFKVVKLEKSECIRHSQSKKLKALPWIFRWWRR